MKRNILRKGAKMAFDHTGQLVEKSAVQEKQLYSANTRNEYFRLKWIEKYYFKWMSVGSWGLTKDGTCGLT